MFLMVGRNPQTTGREPGLNWCILSEMKACMTCSYSTNTVGLGHGNATEWNNITSELRDPQEQNQTPTSTSDRESEKDESGNESSVQEFCSLRQRKMVTNMRYITRIGSHNSMFSYTLMNRHIDRNQIMNWTLRGMETTRNIFVRTYSEKAERYDFSVCSLYNLACEIDITFHYLKDYFFTELSLEKVIDIQRRILEGTYRLSPLILRDYTDEPRKGKYYSTWEKIPVKDEHLNIYYLCVCPTLEDSLVLTSLGRMLHFHFLKVNLFMDNSLGFRITRNEYLDRVCALGNVISLYEFDFKKSFRTINRDSFVGKLSEIVKNRDIIELVVEYLNLSIKDYCSGRDFTAVLGYRIPPAGFLSHILFNFALTELDKEFQRVFPGLYYSRFYHVVVVPFPSTSSSKQGKTLESEDIFEPRVLSLFEQLHLGGKIFTIRPGDAPCLGTLFSVSKEGEIQVNEKCL